MIIFGSIQFLSKPITKPKKKIILKNRNRFKPVGFGLVRFFRIKTGSTSLARFFLFWLSFFWFGLVFQVWLGFCLVISVWLDFG